MNSAVGNWNSDNDNDYALTPSVNKFPVRPVVTLVTVPNVSMKVGDVVTATITVHDDRDAPHTFTSGTIGGVQDSRLAVSQESMQQPIPHNLPLQKVAPMWPQLLIFR